MRLYPAIDILEGNAVRLVKGDFEASTTYDTDPLAAASSWVADGARHLHVVDLDGAKAGEPVNLDQLARIAGQSGVPVQYGGGLRSAEAVRDALTAGASRVILGTAAFTDPGLISAALAEHGPDRILVSLDARDGRVATHGWLQSTDVPIERALSALHEQGVRGFVYTDIDHDGMLDGADCSGVEALAAGLPAQSLIVSGGIGSLADLEQLAALELAQIDGVIVGKALYERRFTVAQARAALNDQ